MCLGQNQRPPLSLNTQECGLCHIETCRTPSSYECLAGYVMDKCGCCQICGRTEHQLCDLSPNEGKYGICGDNLDCRRKPEIDNMHVCTCAESQLVCGSDHSTYETICALNEESIRRGPPSTLSPALSMLYWGPCKESPVIISKPDDSYGPLGANLTLDCEARGFPAPTITWRFVNTEGKTISLPSMIIWLYLIPCLSASFSNFKQIFVEILTNLKMHWVHFLQVMIKVFPSR